MKIRLEHCINSDIVKLFGPYGIVQITLSEFMQNYTAEEIEKLYIYKIKEMD